MEHFDSLSVPEWAVVPIVYGDYSGLTDAEIVEVGTFAEKYPESRFYIEWGYEPYFSNNPAFGLPSTCIDAVIYGREGGKA